MSDAEFHQAVRSYYTRKIIRRSNELSTPRAIHTVTTEDESERSWRERTEEETVEQTAAELKARLQVGRQKLQQTRQNSIPIDETIQHPLVFPESKFKNAETESQLKKLLDTSKSLISNPCTSTPISSTAPPIFASKNTSLPASPLFPFDHESRPNPINLTPIPKSEHKRTLSTVMISSNVPSINFINTSSPNERKPILTNTSIESQPTTSQSSSPAVPQNSSVARERRLSKSETPHSSGFARWVESLLKTNDRYMADVHAVKRDPAMKVLCNKVRMEIQEIVDICSSEDPKDTTSVSKALCFFQDLFTVGPIGADGQRIAITENWRSFLMVSICERYLKRVMSDELVLKSVAQLFMVLIKLYPNLFTVLLCTVYSNCLLPRLNANQCLSKIIELTNGPSEDVPIFVATEFAQFRLLIVVCAMTSTMEAETQMHGYSLIWYLLNEVVHLPVVPLATPFVLNVILSITFKSLKMRYAQTPQFLEIMQQAKIIANLDWTRVIELSIDSTPEVNFSERGRVLLTAKNNSMVQKLKVTFFFVTNVIAFCCCYCC
ncbi:hypothetical protein M3Y94_00207800 [Aphelenchoides besseyi]|nr:hypothetical protein M3Y94_00207800 [Aphelenchoides besseyi]